MRTYNKFLTLTVAIIIFSTANIFAQNFADNKPERTLEQKIYKKLLYLSRYGVFDHITFRLENGVVTLDGKVNSIGTKDEAKSEVEDIPGVTNVVNNIEQLPASSYDNDIRREALRKFVNGGVSQYLSDRNPEVRIIVENGRLTLEGYVRSKGAYDTFNVLANGVSGAFKVQNNLIVGKDTDR